MEENTGKFCDKGFVSRVYKGFLHVNNQKRNQLKKKNIFKRHFRQRYING